VNEPDDRFCGECGAALGGEVVAPTASATATPAVVPAVAPASPAAEERRQVTVLFADLVGFTALAERLDPEDVRDITTDCLRQLTAEAVRFEGTVDKLIGDAVMVLFGAPIAHEDDPGRALRTALAMQRALGRFNEDLERRRGLALRLRIGVESGEVIAGPREVGGMVEYTVIGDAVNVAARLQTAAEPGAILVGEVTCQRVGDAFLLREAGALTLKGRARPVGASVLLGEAAASPMTAPRVPLVGRSVELGVLLERLAALQAGTGGAVCIMAGPGLGKSRLLAELRAQALNARWVRCQAYAHEHAASYGLARSLVRALIGLGPDAAETMAGTHLHQSLAALGLAGEGAALARLLDLPAPRENGAEDAGELDGLAPRDLQRRLFDAVDRLVERLATAPASALTLVGVNLPGRPLVIELDDLHWADPTSTDLLLDLVDRAEQWPVLICGAFRPEADAPCQALRERARQRLGERYAEIELRPLSDDASMELAARLLSQGDQAGPTAAIRTLPATLHDLLERAAGTPLWLEELVRTLVERGLLVVEADGWRLTDDLSAIDLPDSLQALIVARIDRLGTARPTLQVASVIGRRFGRTILEQVTEAASDLDDDLGRAQRADLVRELPSPIDREYDFKHALVRDAAYTTLLHRRRRVLHRRVAEAIETLHRDGASEHHAILAFHYEHAEEWRRAHEHARAAAEAARAGFANREAVESYGLALQMAERARLEPGERAALFEGRAGAHELLGAFEAARSDYEAALALAEAANDDAAQVRLLGALGMLWGGHKDYQRGIELTRQAADLAGRTGHSQAQADSSVQLGIMLLNHSRMAEGREALERALTVYRQLDDAHGQARALDALGLLAFFDGSLDESVTLLEDAYARLSALGDRAGAASSATLLCVPLAGSGRRVDAERWMRRGLALWQAIGAPSGEAFAWMVLAEGMELYGAYTQAGEAAENGLAIARELGHREWTLACLNPLGRIRRARGDLVGALAVHQEVLAIAQELGTPLWAAEAFGDVARDQLLLGDRAAAWAASDESLAIGDTCAKETTLARMVRTRLLLDEGRAAEALTEARLTRTIVAQYRVRLPDAWCLEGDSLAALGQDAEAEHAYRAGLAVARTYGIAPGLWRAGRALHDCLGRAGRPDEANAVMEAVLADLDGLATTLGEPDLRAMLSVG
jgi:class 3 adenylate cyclase/predicted ATPase